MTGISISKLHTHAIYSHLRPYHNLAAVYVNETRIGGKLEWTPNLLTLYAYAPVGVGGLGP
jgi:hypothetical protein